MPSLPRCFFVKLRGLAAISGVGSLGLSCASTHPAEPRPVATSVAEPVPRTTASVQTPPPEATATEVEGLVNGRDGADATDSAETGDDASQSGEGIGLGNLGKLGGAPGNVPLARVRAGDVHATGDLPVEIIERIVRQNFGHYRFCYEEGLRKNRNLTGQISVHFTIDADGTIGSDPTAGKSHFADRRVVECVLNGFRNLSFPQPQAGVVNVVFELIFLPLEQPAGGQK